MQCVRETDREEKTETDKDSKRQLCLILLFLFDGLDSLHQVPLSLCIGVKWFILRNSTQVRGFLLYLECGHTHTSKFATVSKMMPKH